MVNLTRREREKLIREEEIILAAESIFGEKGYEDASMHAIAKAAEFTKKTIYLYFENKEELYFAVVLKGFKKLYAYFETADEMEQSGFLKLQNFGRCYFQFYRENPQILQIIGYLGHVKRNIEVDSSRLEEIYQYNHKIIERVANAIRRGKQDGSIRAGIDEKGTAFSLVFMITGFFNQLSATGATYTEHFSLNLDDFCSSSMDLILRSIKSEKGGDI